MILQFMHPGNQWMKPDSWGRSRFTGGPGNNNRDKWLFRLLLWWLIVCHLIPDLLKGFAYVHNFIIELYLRYA